VTLLTAWSRRATPQGATQMSLFMINAFNVILSLAGVALVLSIAAGI
jgi:hypothetical protein